ncbi:MAG: M15 family metallopeptidase [Actinomycetia bacterium]|nr:M15 family metallopeptidase [Actinomycetes bacterium]
MRRALVFSVLLLAGTVLASTGADARVGPPGVVDIELDPDGIGFWLLDQWGQVTANQATDHGGLEPFTQLAADETVVSMSITTTGDGYWLFTSRGRVWPFGAAVHYGDAQGLPLNQPIIDSVATTSGNGYFMVALDGGVFAYGDARFAGSMGGQTLNAAVIGLVPGPDSSSYWLVASDGGVFAFGVPFQGSMGAVALNQPVVGAVGAASGYLLVAADGGLFDFSITDFLGSLGSRVLDAPAVAAASTARGDRYVIALGDGTVWQFSEGGPLNGELVATLAPGPAPAAEFGWTVSAIDTDLRARIEPTSWRPGCPVALEDLRFIEVSHWDYEGRHQTGELVVHADAVTDLESAFARLFDLGFRINRMELVDEFGGHDLASMQADNTSAFNCRTVAGTTRWSQHAYGRAIDINPLRNPYLSSGEVSPPEGAPWTDRTLDEPGMIRRGEGVVEAFTAVGWGWGGDWSSSKDWQHFSATGV